MDDPLFIGMLSGAFSDQFVRTEEDTQTQLASSDRYREPEMIEKLSAVICDNSLTWHQKADRYLLIHSSNMSDEEGTRIFKYVWKTLLAHNGRNDPWPLDSK